MVLPRAERAGGREVAERVRTAVESQPILHAPTLHVTMSLGVACGTADTTAEALIHAADQALYRAKANGRNRVESA
jgi:diguanylate cyclase (GGDEF)-like protein